MAQLVTVRLDKSDHQRAFYASRVARLRHPSSRTEALTLNKSTLSMNSIHGPHAARNAVGAIASGGCSASN
ncbi:hypothetical protein EVAR_100140_1 [Eumeta japonica]|uniref:Uncharacterized protein n=1 Tax=Eumeta variegata TaxID=151549 RepID=A0A4C1SCD9_EUMVA|nr:hypothetical protein EVAR_100140_1 [Eumeta japonica]